MIHITHRNVTETSHRIVSGPQKGKTGVSPTFYHHRAPNSSGTRGSDVDHLTAKGWVTAERGGKASLPWHCLCRQARSFQRMTHLMVLRMVSTRTPLGTCNSRKTEVCPLPQLVGEQRQEPPGSHSEHWRYSSATAWNRQCLFLCHGHVFSLKGINRGEKAHKWSGWEHLATNKRGLPFLVQLLKPAHPPKHDSKAQLRNGDKGFLPQMKLLDLRSVFSWGVKLTDPLRAALIFTDRLSCRNSLCTQVKSKHSSLQE